MWLYKYSITKYLSKYGWWYDFRKTESLYEDANLIIKTDKIQTILRILND